MSIELAREQARATVEGLFHTVQMHEMYHIDFAGLETAPDVILDMDRIPEGVSEGREGIHFRAAFRERARVLAAGNRRLLLTGFTRKGSTHDVVMRTLGFIEANLGSESIPGRLRYALVGSESILRSRLGARHLVQFEIVSGALGLLLIVGAANCFLVPSPPVGERICNHGNI